MCARFLLTHGTELADAIRHYIKPPNIILEYYQQIKMAGSALFMSEAEITDPAVLKRAAYAHTLGQHEYFVNVHHAMVLANTYPQTYMHLFVPTDNNRWGSTWRAKWEQTVLQEWESKGMPPSIRNTLRSLVGIPDSLNQLPGFSKGAPILARNRLYGMPPPMGFYSPQPSSGTRHGRHGIREQATRFRGAMYRALTLVPADH
jgi:hypothetical protein